MSCIILRPDPQVLFNSLKDAFSSTVLGGGKVIPESNEWYVVTNDYAAAEQFYAIADQMWRETTDQPLRLIGSYDNLLYGTLIYFPERPSTLEIMNPTVTPWTDAARIAREGIALFCPLEVTGCVQAMNERAARGPAGKRAEVELSRTYFGVADQPVRYVIVTIPPGT